jgi:hypothetical protein
MGTVQFCQKPTVFLENRTIFSRKPMIFFQKSCMRNFELTEETTIDTTRVKKVGMVTEETIRCRPPLHIKWKIDFFMEQMRHRTKETSVARPRKQQLVQRE